jgi:hypothetical protein
LSPFLGKNMYEKSHFGYIPATLKNYAMSPWDGWFYIESFSGSTWHIYM